MYAVNPEAMNTRPILEGSNLLAPERNVSEELQLLKVRSRRQNNGSGTSALLSSVSGTSRSEDSGEALSMTRQDEWEGLFVASPWVPVVKCVLEFAKQGLWMPEVRRE